MSGGLTAILLDLGTAIPIMGGVALAATGHLARMYSGPQDSSVETYRCQSCRR